MKPVERKVSGVWVLLSGLGGAAAVALVVAIGFPAKKAPPATPATESSRPGLRERSDYPDSPPIAPPPGHATAPTRREPPPQQLYDANGIPNLNLSPEQATVIRVKKELDALERSGAADSTLTTNAIRAVDNMKRMPQLSRTEFGDFKCFGAGCAVTITSLNSPSAASDGQAIVRSKEFQYWRGVKFLSGPLSVPSGQVRTVLILFKALGGDQPAANNG